MFWKNRSRKARVVLLGTLALLLMCACGAVLNLLGYGPASTPTPAGAEQVAQMTTALTEASPSAAAPTKVPATATPVPSPTSTEVPPTATPEPTGTVVAPTSTVATTPTPVLIEAQVVDVVDGDTIRVTIDGQEYTVRYIGIDTPETVRSDTPVQWMGPEAAEANAALVAGQTVYLEKDISETDRYGRLLAYIYLADGRMVNEELVRLGYAYSSSYPPDVYRQGALIAAQQTAVASGAGLWGTPPAEVAALTPTPEVADRAVTIDLGSAVILSEYGGTQVPEFMVVTNTGDANADLTGWQIVSVRHGDEYQSYTFPQGYILPAGVTVRVYSGPGAGDAAAADGGLFWTEDRMWNDEGDTAELYDADGELVSNLG